jgi:hypothetical protein
MSKYQITYLDEFIPQGIFCINNPKIAIIDYYKFVDIKKFLNNLEFDTQYVITLEFISSFAFYDSDGPTIHLSKPILVTKNSNPKLISDFIKKRIELVFDSFYLDDTFISNMKGCEKPGLLIQYEKINIHQ